MVIPTMSWEDYVHLAFDEIRIAGALPPRCRVGCWPRSTTSSWWRPTIDGRLWRSSATCYPGRHQPDRDGRDRAFAMAPDDQGLGVAVDGDTTIGGRYA